jgi:hypothetical protein
MTYVEEMEIQHMTQTLLVTTIHRDAPANQSSGAIYTVDFARRRVTSRTPIIEAALRQFDPNPRGGLRGGRGITVIGDSVCIANSTSIFHFDQAWRLLKVISHPLGADLHDMTFHDGCVWATSSRNDLVLAFALNGELRHLVNLYSLWRATQKPTTGRSAPTDYTSAPGTFDFRDPRTHRKRHYDHLHVNSLAFHPDGRLLLLFGMITSLRTELLLAFKNSMEQWGCWNPLLRLNQLLVRWFRLHPPKQTKMVTGMATGKAAIVQVQPDGQPTIPFMLPNTIVPVHSLQLHGDDTVLLNDTNAQEIVQLHLASGTVLSRTEVPHGFLRGLVRISDDLLVAGNQNYLQVVDLRNQRLGDQIKISDHPKESVFDIKILPAAFSLPPERFLVS